MAFSGTTRVRAVDARSAALIPAVVLLAFGLNAACRSSNRGEAPASLIVIRAPAAGEVRRVLVSEGARVNEGAAIIEIAIRADAAASAQDPSEEQARARAALDAAQREVADAEAEVNRAAVEVQRIEPLVTSGAAPQAQLDAARAQYQQAQERVERVRETARGRQAGIVSQQAGRSAPSVAQAESIVAVVVPATGTVRVLSARIGQRVTAGQALATLSPQPR